LQVYTALLRRNAAAVKVDTWSGQSGDAAQLLARMFPRAQTSGGYNNLSEFAADMASVKETHHFYPVLYYFRFRESRYSMSRTELVAMDAAALLTTALDDEQFGWIKTSAALAQLEDSALMLLQTLSEVSHEGLAPREPHREPAESVHRWQQRFAAAITQLRRAGLPITADEAAAAAEYVRLRSRWNASLESLASALGYEIEDIDPVVAALRRRPPLEPLAAST
jgi:hypothetical protein